MTSIYGDRSRWSVYWDAARLVARTPLAWLPLLAGICTFTASLVTTWAGFVIVNVAFACSAFVIVRKLRRH